MPTKHSDMRQNWIQFSQLSTDQALNVERYLIARNIVTGLIRGPQTDDLSPSQTELVEASIRTIQEHLEPAIWANDLTRLPRSSSSETEHGVYCHVLERSAGTTGDAASVYVYVGEISGKGVFRKRLKYHRKARNDSHRDDRLHYYL